MIVSRCVPESSRLKLNCHASITKRDSFRRLDQVPCDSDCLADHHLSGFDNRLRDVRWRLEVLTDSLVASRRSAQLSSPTAEQSPTPTPTIEPVL